jgi:hypothetical protein
MFGLITWMIITAPFYAQSHFEYSVHDIDFGDPGSEVLVLLTSGQVKRYMAEDLPLSLLSNLQSTPKITPNKSFYPQAFEAVPTIVESSDQARLLFKLGRHKIKTSECFNRAHVWAYELFKNHQVNALKTWIFFSRKYIRKFAFDWWFHVAPSIVVKEENDVFRHQVMDLKYASRPLNTKDWTDIFMRNKASCHLIKSYSDYANYPESEWCYVMRTNMYYYQPLDMEDLETRGEAKTMWIFSEIRQAYEDALDESFGE